jgi:hypothetical protein
MRILCWCPTDAKKTRDSCEKVGKVGEKSEEGSRRWRQIVMEVTAHCDGNHKSLILMLLHYCSRSSGDVKWRATNVAPHLVWVGKVATGASAFSWLLLKAVKKNPDSGCFGGPWGVPREVLRLPS